MTTRPIVPTTAEATLLIPRRAGVRGLKTPPTRPRASGALSVSEAFDLYREHLARTGASPHTLVNWRTRAQIFLAWCGEQGLARPDEIHIDDLEQ